MAFSFILLLLAACFNIITAGPVPRLHQRQLFTSYANSSSTIPSSTDVQADTAIVIEPIKPTIFTSIAPAVTFVNPGGQPLATQDPRTVLFTSFIMPAPAPTMQKSTSALPTPSPKPRPVESHVTSSSSAVVSAAPSSTVAVADNSTTTQSSKKVPVFTYSPTEDESSTAPASPTVSLTSATPAPTSGGLSGFQHPGSASRSPQAANTTTSATTARTPSPVIQGPSSASFDSSSTMNSASSTSPVATLPSASQTIDVTSRVVVTQYTTVYAIPSASEAQEAPSLASPTSDMAGVPDSSSPAQISPSASLQIPPVVIVTSFTTLCSPVIRTYESVSKRFRANVNTTHSPILSVCNCRTHINTSHDTPVYCTNHDNNHTRKFHANRPILIHATPATRLRTTFLIHVTASSTTILRQTLNTHGTAPSLLIFGVGVGIINTPTSPITSPLILDFSVTNTPASPITSAHEYLLNPSPIASPFFIFDDIGRSANHHADTAESDFHRDSYCYCDADGEGDCERDGDCYCYC
ncbi:PAT1 domain containing protein [Pyrenophora teres f. maculata]|nr:PAT1 domain containing protein [Pyrenophora teres f. maculata]